MYNSTKVRPGELMDVLAFPSEQQCVVMSERLGDCEVATLQRLHPAEVMASHSYTECSFPMEVSRLRPHAIRAELYTWRDDCILFETNPLCIALAILELTL